jgi:exonuclease SbcD
MTRVAHLADLHLCERVRYEGTLRCLRVFVDQVRSRGADIAVIAGDLVDPRRAPARATPTERNALAFQLRRLASECPVAVVRGNHDALGDWSFLSSMRTAGNPVYFTECPRPTIWANRGLIGEVGVCIVSIPWISPRDFASQARALDLDIDEGHAWTGEAISRMLDEIRPDVEQLRQEGIPIVGVAHASIRGGRLGSGQVLVGGEVQLPREVLDGFPFDYLALGHLHERQQATARGWYSGSPNRLDFGEAGKPCSWNMVEVEPGSEPVVEYVDLPADELATMTGIVHEGDDGIRLDLSTEHAPEDLAGAEVRLRLVVPEGLAGEDLVAQAIRDVESRGATVVVQRIPVAALRARAGSEEIAAAPSARAKVEAFLGQRDHSAAQVARVLRLLDDIEGEVG